MNGIDQMNEEEIFSYMMASEKMVSMILLMEQNFEFFQEYKITADEEVKKALIPLLQKWEIWINAESKNKN